MGNDGYDQQRCLQWVHSSIVWNHGQHQFHIVFCLSSQHKLVDYLHANNHRGMIPDRYSLTLKTKTQLWPILTAWAKENLGKSYEEVKISQNNTVRKIAEVALLLVPSGRLWHKPGTNKYPCCSEEEIKMLLLHNFQVQVLTTSHRQSSVRHYRRGIIYSRGIILPPPLIKNRGKKRWYLIE